MEIEELKEIILDQERILVEKIDEKYQSDTLGRLKGNADAVVFPISTTEVSKVLKFAWKNEIPVTPRGAGTNLVGSTVPVNGGIVVDLSLMNRILEIDQDTFTATVEAGYDKFNSNPLLLTFPKFCHTDVIPFDKAVGTLNNKSFDDL